MSVVTQAAVKARREARPLPAAIEDIDAEWLSAALAAYAPGAKVERFRVVDVIHGFTTLLRLEVELNAAGRAAGVGSTLMLKAGFEPHSDTFAGSYAMEVAGARDVWPGLGLRTPVYYFADADAERGRTMILMEDLKARGVAFCDPFQSQTYDQAAQRMVALAQAHARTWDSPEIKPGGRYHDVVLANGAALLRAKHMGYGSFTPQGWKAWTDLPRGAASSAAFKTLDWVLRATAYIARLSDEIPNAVIHGDCHQGNLYLDVDGEPGFFDSMPRREPPYFEAGYAITCALDVADRKAFDHALLRVYASEAQRCGVKTSYEEVLHYYKIFLFQGWMYFMVNSTAFQTEGFNTLHAARFNAAMLDHGTYDLISALA